MKEIIKFSVDRRERQKVINLLERSFIIYRFEDRIEQGITDFAVFSRGGLLEEDILGILHDSKLETIRFQNDQDSNKKITVYFKIRLDDYKNLVDQLEKDRDIQLFQSYLNSISNTWDFWAFIPSWYLSEMKEKYKKEFPSISFEKEIVPEEKEEIEEIEVKPKKLSNLVNLKLQLFSMDKDRIRLSEEKYLKDVLRYEVSNPGGFLLVEQEQEGETKTSYFNLRFLISIEEV